MFLYNIGCCGCTGAGLPPNPVSTASTEVAPNGDVLPTLPPPKLLGADVVPTLVVALKPPVGALGELNPVEGAPNAGAPVENPAVGVCIPPLFAPANFSCVRPMMGWLYMATCTFDFVIFPILCS